MIKYCQRYCALLLFTEILTGINLLNATPLCPSYMSESSIKIYSQEALDRAIDNLTCDYCSKSKCVTISMLGKQNFSFKLNLVKLLNASSNFVIGGRGQQQVKLECMEDAADMYEPLSALKYVGFYQLAFYNCMVPLWIENVETVVMENVTFRNSKEGAVNIFNCHNVSIVNCSFENNNSTGQFAKTKFQGSSGGLSIGIHRKTTTILLGNISVLVDSCRFINNFAHAFGSDVHTATSLLSRNIITGRGGGMSLTIDSSLGIHSVVTNNYYENNRARVYGGGLYFLVNEVTQNQTYLFKENCFINNQAELTSGAMIYGLIGRVRSGVSINVNILQNHFEGNSAQFGGAVRFQRPTGNQGNSLIFDGCIFNRNTAVESGAAIGISKAQFFNFDQRSIPITIINCTFSENTSLRGGTVFSAYTAVAFNGSNLFKNNRGVALNLLSSTVQFYGSVGFVSNSVENFDGGALYLTSLSQMVLYSGANLSFINNTGSFGSAIVAETPSRVTRSIFGTTSLCFMQMSPYAWSNVTINFTANRAIVGSDVYTNNAEHCLTNSNIDDASFDWPFMQYSKNNINTGHVNSTDPRYYIQTPLLHFDIANSTVEMYPGKSFPLKVTSRDQLNLPAAGILQLSLQDRFVSFKPSAIIMRPIHQSYNFTYDVTDNSVNITNSAFAIQSFKSASQVGSPRKENIALTVLPCPPGHVLQNECQCDRNDVFLVDCFENYTAVILRLGLWAYTVDNSLEYHQCPHGYCQCIKVDQNGMAQCSSVYYYNKPDKQCNCDRKGILCGQCVDDDAGVSVLLNRCVHCSSINTILIGAVLVIGLVVASILLSYPISLPEWIYPFLFYIQITSYVTENYQTSFSYIQQTNLYVSSALSLYFPYDFCLSAGLTTLMAYALRYIPLLASILALLIVAIFKCFRLRNYHHMNLSWDGLWVLIMLVYSHIMHTSLSILHCVQVAGTNHHKKSVWFVDGTVECFTGGHAALASLAIIVFISSAMLLLFMLLISLRKIKRRWALDLSNVLIKPFRHGYVWWSLVELSRRFLIILFIVIIPGNHVPSLLLLTVYILLYGYVQPFKSKFVNVLEFVYLVDIFLLQMIKSTIDIKTANFLDVIEYQKDCGNAIKVNQFSFTLMTLLLYIPVVVTVLLIIGYAGMTLVKKYNLKFKPVKSRHNSFHWSYARSATAAVSSYFLVTDDGAHLYPQSNNDNDACL